MKIVAALATIALSGCAGTIDQNRARPAAATFSTALAEPAVEHCLAGKLSWMGDPSVIRGEGSTEIAFNSPYGTELLVTILPVGSGSRLELRMKHRNYLDHLIRTVQSCI